MSEVNRDLPKYEGQPVPHIRNREERERHYQTQQRNHQIARKLDEIRSGPASASVV